MAIMSVSMIFFTGRNFKGLQRAAQDLLHRFGLY